MKYLQPVNGNRGSNLHNLIFLLDESLVPAVAKALSLVGYNFVDVVATLGQRGIKDPKIIEWCKEKKAVWVHADDRARKEHKKLLQTSGIQTIWLYRKDGQMTGKEQLRILAFVLPIFLSERKKHPKQRHYKASASTHISKPSLRAIEI